MDFISINLRSITDIHIYYSSYYHKNWSSWQFEHILTFKKKIKKKITAYQCNKALVRLLEQDSLIGKAELDGCH